ncbi:MAG: Holliday junction resolvase RecU [Lachnospiraceae bacterium]|nr:Holliday junction resolvase RecU [Lachnospiraceae bacterium]
MKLRGLRGSVLEDMVNKTISDYRVKKLALIQKIPTPIVPTKMDKEGHITLAYFDKKSTVDYIGVVQEIPVCFDAKECSVDTFPMSNIHKHQFEFMEDFEEQGGISFILLYFSKKSTAYYLRFSELKKYWSKKKAINFDELDNSFVINMKGKIKIDILSKLQLDIDER